MFEGISTFDAQNPIVRSLLRELDIERKDLASELIKKAPRPGIDLEVQKRQKDNKLSSTSTTANFTPFIATAEANTEDQTNGYPKPTNDAFWRNDNEKNKI